MVDVVLTRIDRSIVIYQFLPSLISTKLLVNRGWIPYRRKEWESRPEGQITGRQRITALVRAGDQPSSYTPSNDYRQNIWFWVDLEAITAVFETIPLYLEMRGTLSGNHRSVAVTLHSRTCCRNDNDNNRTNATWRISAAWPDGRRVAQQSLLIRCDLVRLDWLLDVDDVPLHAWRWQSDQDACQSPLGTALISQSSSSKAINQSSINEATNQ